MKVNKYVFAVNYHNMNTYIEIISNDVVAAKRILRQSLEAADIVDYKFSLIAINSSFFAEAQDVEEHETIDTDKFYVDLEVWRESEEFKTKLIDATLDRFSRENINE